MARKKHPKYPKELRTPIPYAGPRSDDPRRTSLLDEHRDAVKREEYEASCDHALAMMAKLPALENFYKIDQTLDPKTRTLILLMTVCKEFIPGFRQKDYRKGKKDWSIDALEKLRVAAELLKPSLKPKEKVAEALKKQPAYRTFSVPALERQLAYARNPNVNYLPLLHSTLEKGCQIAGMDADKNTLAALKKGIFASADSFLAWERLFAGLGMPSVRPEK